MCIYSHSEEYYTVNIIKLNDFYLILFFCEFFLLMSLNILYFLFSFVVFKVYYQLIYH